MSKKLYTSVSIMILATCLTAALTGCGGDGRVAIQGTVTFDGQPLKTGQISFMPMQGTKGPTAGSNIKDGAFDVPPEGGALPGKYRVEITATRASNRKVYDPESDQMVTAPVQFIPPQYNMNSQLTADVEPGGDNNFTFELTSR